MRFSTFFSAIPFVLLGACATTEHVTVPAGQGDNSSATVPASDAASFCKALCDRQGQCDSSLDQQTCANACKNQSAAVFPRLRQDVVDLVVSCMDAKDCKTVLGGQVVGTCASEAVARVAPSDAAIQYCDAVTAAEQKCGRTQAKAQCLDGAKLYSDDAIAEAQNCTTRSCTEIDSCVTAVFGSFGGATTTSPASPTKPTSTCTSGQFADLGSCSSCAEKSCCAEASACATDASCRELMDICTQATGMSSSCSSYMSSATTSGKQLAATYFTCASQHCSSSCNWQY